MKPDSFFKSALPVRIVWALLVVLVMGGIPGLSAKGVMHDLVAPPVPADVKQRDARVDVVVEVEQGGAAGPALAGAQVRVIAIVGDRAYLAGTATTGPDGRAALEHLPRGEAWVLAEAPGRRRASTHVVLDAEARTLELVLGEEHSVDVLVRDELGGPIAGADVEIAAGDPLPFGARADAEGRAHVGRLPPGPWRVSARAPGYDEAQERGVKEGDTATLVLRKLASLLVRVVGDGGEPIAGARVAVEGAMLWPARAADTDASGAVRIGGLPPGTYALRATKGDLVSPIELGVLLGRGEEKAVLLSLAPGRWVETRVTDGDADDAPPIAGARLSLAEGGLSPFPVEATSDAKGHARLGPIAPGPATLSARAEGFVPRAAMSVPDPPPPELRVVLVRGGTLEGRVVDARGFPVDGATIEIVGTDSLGAPIFDDPRRASFRDAHFDAMLAGPAPLIAMGELGVVPGPVPPIPHDSRFGAQGFALGPETTSLAEPWVTRSDGTFRATPVSPGRVRAVVHHPQYVEAQSEIVTLAPGGEAHVDIVMHEGGTLEGRVVDTNDRPVEGARVTVSATHGSLERSTRSASDGTFAFASLPDAVSLTASIDEDDEQPDVRMEVAIPEGGRKEVKVQLPEPRAPLAVSVVDDRDFPVDAAQVTASSLVADAPLRTTAFTDARGQATVKKARGLPLRVEVSAPGRAPRVVATDGAADSLRVVLAPAESATGEVVASRHADPIADAQVTLYTDLGARRTRTDASGAYSITGLAPGPARIDVRAAGYAPVSKAITIAESGGRRPFAVPRVELSEEGSVEGDVVDSHGAAVPGARVARDHVPTWLLVGASPAGVAVTDARGHFTLHELPEGTVVIEAYAPDVGRARVDDVKVVAGRTTTGVHVVLAPGGSDQAADHEPAATGNVAVTLGETGAPVEVVIVSVVEGSEAERAGLAPGDVVVSVDGAAVRTIEEARAKLAGPIAADVVLRVRRADQTMAVRVAREAVRR